MGSGRGSAVVFALAMVISAACSANAPAAQSSASGPIDPRLTTLTIGVSSEAQTFDPQVNNALVSAYRFYPNIYETLVQYAPDGTIKPMLADSWTIGSDGLVYTFKRHPGVKFSDNTSFDADAVKASFDRFNRLGKGAIVLFSAVDSIRAADSLTVEFRLKQPYAPFLAILAAWQSAIFVSPTSIKANAGTDDAQTYLRDHTAGTGPFVLDSWVPNGRIVMVRNPGYRAAASPSDIQRVVYTFVPEPGTLRQQLEAGDIDIDDAVTPALLGPLSRASGVKVSTDPSTGSSFGQWIAFNLSKKPFDDVNFRRAISYTIDYKRLVTVWNGIAEQAQGPLPPNFQPWFSAADAFQYQQDLAKAKEYLQKAGFSSPIDPPMKVDLTWQIGFTGQRDMAQLIKEDLAKIGIDLQIVQLELPQWRQAIWDHVFQLTYFQDSFRYADPDAFASFQLDSSEFRTGGTNPGVRSAAVDDLVRTAKTTIDPVKRRSIYNQIQKMVTEDPPYLWLVNTKIAWAAGKNVTGITWNPYYGQFWRAADIKKTSLRS